MTMLSWIALVFIIVGCMQFAVILIDILKHPQKNMVIMNIVWPLTGLYFPLLGIIAYYYLGKEKSHQHQHEHDHHMHHQSKPFWKSVVVSTTHCSAGCALGDLIGAPIVFYAGITIFTNQMATEFLVEFILAYIFGLMFQYFHMEIKHDHPGRDLIDAIKADTLSLIAFEIGMFGFMIIMHMFINPNIMSPNHLEYWFLMQIAMLIGFMTSYPVNWYLVKKGIKHAM
nr:DUF4396 domain-containing protein [Mammaliicoccus sp. Marseille-Q6498]